MVMAAMHVAWRTLGADHTRRTLTDERGEGGWLRGTPACRLGEQLLAWCWVEAEEAWELAGSFASGGGGRGLAPVDAWCDRVSWG